MKSYYSSQAPLVSREYKTLKRGIGVAFYGPFSDYKGETLLNISYEIPTVDTATYGSNIPIFQANEKAVTMTEHILEKLDVILLELHEHRKRLKKELEKLKQTGITAQPVLFLEAA